MIGQTRINYSDAIAETLAREVANGNDFRSVAIDVAPSPLAFDGREPFRIGLRGLEAGCDYDFSAVIDKSPGGSQRCGKEWVHARRLLGRLLATARRDEQREDDRKRDRTAAMHPSAKIM